METILGGGDTGCKSAVEQIKSACLCRIRRAGVTKQVRECVILQGREEGQASFLYNCKAPGVAQGLRRCHVAHEWSMKCREEEKALREEG